MKKKILSVAMAITMITTITVTNGLETKAQNSELNVDIGGITVDVEELAEENNVDPNQLKEEIIKGLSEEKASPFSSLVVSGENNNQETALEQTIQIQQTATGRSLSMEYKSNQDSTAYVASSGALTASGKTPTVGMCAMHINVTTKTGSTSSSQVKLGTTIYLDKYITVNGNTYSSMVVEDRGNPSNRTPYWIDVYFGLNNTSNYNAAINYGIKTVTYHYYY